MKLIVFIFALFSIEISFSFVISNFSNSDCDEPLFLTPLIKNGDFEKARQCSFVEPFPSYNYTSYSGFLTIDEVYDSNMFFWYFLAKNNPDIAPVLLWMTGGPGISSLYALFGEIGPFYIDQDIILKPREYNWITDYNVIFVDVPIGAGFSFTNSTSGYATNTPQMASQVSKFIDQFFLLFHEFRDNDFYIVGKSYSGKLAVSLVQKILRKNQSTELRVNLRGMVTICGFLDPLTMVWKGDILYRLGFLNKRQKNSILEQELLVKEYAQNGSIQQAITTLFVTYETIRDMTGLIEFSNFMFTELPRVFSDYEIFVGQIDVRNRIHVGNITFNSQEKNVTKAVRDFVESTKNDLEYILNNSSIKVLLFSGQFDLLINPVVHSQFVLNLDWIGKLQFKNSSRVVWRVNPNDVEVAGYVQCGQQLCEVMVRNAGHMTAYDQPRAVLDAITKFINGTFD